MQLNSGVKKDSLVEGKPLGVEIKGLKIALFLRDGNVYAIDSICKHEGGPLDEGALEGFDVICPWHAAKYDIRSGKVSDDTPWGTNTTVYKVEIDKESGDILLDI